MKTIYIRNGDWVERPGPIVAHLPGIHDQKDHDPRTGGHGRTSKGVTPPKEFKNFLKELNSYRISNGIQGNYGERNSTSAFRERHLPQANENTGRAPTWLENWRVEMFNGALRWNAANGDYGVIPATAHRILHGADGDSAQYRYANRFMEAVAASPEKDVLYRGVVIADGNGGSVVEDPVGNFNKFLDTFAEGKTVDIPLASTSSKKSVAEAYARDGGSGYSPYMSHWETGAHVLMEFRDSKAFYFAPLSHSESSPMEQEWITGGRFKVADLEVKGEPKLVESWTDSRGKLRENWSLDEVQIKVILEQVGVFKPRR